jgi:hypothetical protein
MMQGILYLYVFNIQSNLIHDNNNNRDFDTKSMFRKPDLINDSVTLIMGKKINSDVIDIVTILFDRATFSEDGARIWWEENRERLLDS